MTGTPTIYFDVDNTLIMHLDGATISNECVAIEVWGMTTYVKPHFKHITTLKKYKEKGFKVVVWSGGGEEWATEVIKSLGLTQHVDVILSKPTVYYDDLEVQDFMPKNIRRYILPE